MDKKTELIHSRNLLMAKLLWILLILDIATIAIFYEPAHLLNIVPVPAGMVLLTIITWLVLKRKLINQTMYFIMALVYIYLFALVKSHTEFVNFVFIWFGLVLSSLYHDYPLIIFSGAMTVGLTNYFFFVYHQQLFPGLPDGDAAFLSLLGVFICVILVITSKFSENLRLKAEHNELEAVGELRSNEQYLESFINNTSDAIVVIDMEGQALRINRAFEKIFGWSSEQVVGQQMLSIPVDLVAETREVWQRVKDGGQVTGLETKRQRKDLRLIDVSVTVSPIRDDQGKVVALACIYRDITERKRTEELLRQSDKLSAVGQLAAGVGHEIRNPLAVIKGFIQLLQQRYTGSEEYFDIMLSEVDRIEEIIREFLLLAKPQMISFSQHDLHTLLENIVVLVGTQAIMNNVQIRLEFEPGVPPVECDKNQMKQVFINLVKNAIEAMPSGGEVTVKVCRQGQDKVQIMFSDQGCGIPEHKLSRLGEPFFTTKEKGTGLGLMVSYKIIHNHRGSISVSSKVGRGTRFKINLPLVQLKVEEQSA